MKRYALLATLASLTLAAASACDSKYEDAEPADAGADVDATTPTPDATTPVSDSGGNGGDGGADAQEDAPTLDGGADATTDADAAFDAAADADASAVDAGPTCPAGFEPGAADGGCVVSNPFADPSFVGTPADAWTTGGGAVILPTETGSYGPGVARISDDTTSPARYRGTVQQTVMIPSSPQVDPFAVRVSSTSTSGSPDAFGFGIYVGGVALYDPYLGRTIKGTSPFSFDICLGERAYGANRVFMLGGTAFVDRVDIEKIELVRTPSCPRPGVIANGDFEAAGGFVYEAGAGTFSLSGGTNDSRSARLATTEKIYPDAIYQSVSIPNKNTAALSLRTYGLGNFRVLLDGREITRRRVDATHDAHTVCLPAWSQGLVLDLKITSGQNDTADPSETGHVIFVDDVAFVDSPSCANGSLAENPSFEATSPTGSDDIPGWSSTVTTGCSITRATTLAHAGNAHLAIQSSENACLPGFKPAAAVSRVFTHPPTSPALGGPAILYWYKFVPGANSVASIYADRVSSVSLVPKTDWTYAVRCLQGNQAGTRVGVRFSLDSTASGCSKAELDIDDVTIGNDASCPVD